MPDLNKVKVSFGMAGSWWFPITAEPANARPTYGTGVDMGAAVKGYLSLTTLQMAVPGDNTNQIDADIFQSGQLDAETTLDDLEKNALLFGHTYSEEAGELSNADDLPASGGYAFTQTLMTKERGKIHRATCFFKTTAIASSEKQEADTRKKGEFSSKNQVFSLKVTEANNGDWRLRQDFATLAEAEAFIMSTFKSA